MLVHNVEHTLAEVLETTKGNGQENCKWRPFLFHNQGADYEEAGWDEYAIDILARGQGCRAHFDSSAKCQ